MKKRTITVYLSVLGICMALSACGEKAYIEQTSQQVLVMESEAENIVENDNETYDTAETPSIPETCDDIEDALLPKTESEYHILDNETVESDYTKYGSMESEHEDVLNQDGSIAFYYDMECFYFDDNYPGMLNETLQNYYNSIRESYRSDSEIYIGDTSEGQNTSYDKLLFQYVAYVGDDYISLVYNNVCNMGGAHPYSAFDGITINCITGEIVEVNEFVDESEEEIGEQLQNVLGFDTYIADEWDYYITENSVVFFYYDPRFWDCVETKRMQ